MKLSKRTVLISVRVCPELLEVMDLINRKGLKHSISDLLHKAVADQGMHGYPPVPLEQRHLLDTLYETDHKKPRLRKEKNRIKWDREKLAKELQLKL